MGVLRYDYQGKSYPKRECELIDRYWVRLNLKLSKNQEKILKILQACMRRLVGARTLKILLTPVNLRKELLQICCFQLNF